MPFPSRPSLTRYRRLARGLQQACKSGDEQAVRDWAARWSANLATLYGPDMAPDVEHLAEGMARRWSLLGRASRCALADAQWFVARECGFASWPRFAQHVTALESEDSAVSDFEAAADAIAGGDTATLAALLRKRPELPGERSMREHRSTLLHYVSANGIEQYRQRTPANIVEVTRLLLQAGADVNAESDAYGGGSTALGLVATSIHPERAGVQEELMQLLLDHGALIDRPAAAGDGLTTVGSCLGNHRERAAEFLAARGARLDLAAAAGLGHLDVVSGFFHEDGRRREEATPERMRDAFWWACEYGRTSVVEFLLEHGTDAAAPLRRGDTGLHWAAYGGHPDIVRLLLARGAPVDVKDDVHDATPEGWAMHGRSSAPEGPERERYDAVIALLHDSLATR
jgi:hypothetical protein